MKKKQTARQAMLRYDRQAAYSRTYRANVRRRRAMEAQLRRERILRNIAGAVAAMGTGVGLLLFACWAA